MLKKVGIDAQKGLFVTCLMPDFSMQAVHTLMPMVSHRHCHIGSVSQLNAKDHPSQGCGCQRAGAVPTGTTARCLASGAG